MFAAWIMNLGRTAAAAVLNTGAGRQSNQTGSGAGTTAPAGGVLIGKGYLTAETSTTLIGGLLSIGSVAGWFVWERGRTSA